jgi:hypothetical protein
MGQRRPFPFNSLRGALDLATQADIEHATPKLERGKRFWILQLSAPATPIIGCALAQFAL